MLPDENGSVDIINGGTVLPFSRTYLHYGKVTFEARKTVVPFGL